MEVIDLTGGNECGVSDRNFIKLVKEFGGPETCLQYKNLKKLLYLGAKIDNPMAWIRNALKNNYELKLNWRDSNLTGHIDL